MTYFITLDIVESMGGCSKVGIHSPFCCASTPRLFPVNALNSGVTDRAPVSPAYTCSVSCSATLLPVWANVLFPQISRGDSIIVAI